MNDGSEQNNNPDEEGKVNLEDHFAVGDAEIETVRQHFSVLDLRQQSSDGSAHLFDPPEGMDAARFQFVAFRLFQQSEGLLFASVDEAFSHEWVEFGKTDFDALLRNKDTHRSLLTDETVKSIYQATWDAATNEKTYLSNSPNPMTWVNHSRLCENVELVAAAAHLCPKTGFEGKTDTWIYVAQAVLGLPVSKKPSNDDILVMRKALRGCYPLPDAKPSGMRQKQDTIHNTGLNRSPCNLLSTMEQKYIFDSAVCLYVLPVMDVLEAKAWNGGSYKVLILCDDDRRRRATHQQVAMRVGLSRTNAAHGTSADIAKAIGLLSCVMKFCAYSLEKMPTPPGKLWTKLKNELLEGRAMYAAIKGHPVGRIDGKIVVPTEKDLGRKVVAKVDLDRSCRGLDNFAFPDPILLACKTSVNWS